MATLRRDLLPAILEKRLLRSKVIITIDTEVRNEGRHLEDAFQRYVVGTGRAENRCSLWISEMLSGRGFPGVFFLDAYGTAEFPRADYKALCEQLLAGGHDIQLHTHPDRMYDRARLNMYEYTLTEQKEIIRVGMDLLRNWTGHQPTVHRAGRYGANEDTLAAIRDNGIFLDSSFFYGRQNCRLPYANTNWPFQAQGIWEVPVTVARIPIEKRGFRFPRWTRFLWRNYQKLDVNCMDANQICRSFSEVYGSVPYIVVFLHSFSFTRREHEVFYSDQNAIDSFLRILDLISAKQAEVVTFDVVKNELAGFDRPNG